MTAMPAAKAPRLDIMRNSPKWDGMPEAEKIVRKAISEAQREASSGGAEIAIVLTDDSEIRKLNRQWRRKDKPTNVLSFPAADGAGEKHLGDIVIAYETLAREALSEGKPLAHHLAHLALHGYLHLLGYDHDSERKAKAMERLETTILARLGVSDPYAGGA
jgi:probable rRNA maturation factor